MGKASVACARAWVRAARGRIRYRQVDADGDDTRLYRGVHGAVEGPELLRGSWLGV